MIVMCTKIDAESVVMARDLEGGFVVSVDTDVGNDTFNCETQQDALQTYCNAVASILFDGALAIDVRAA